MRSYVFAIYVRNTFFDLLKDTAVRAEVEAKGDAIHLAEAIALSCGKLINRDCVREFSDRGADCSR
jgi:hypothetical protein